MEYEDHERQEAASMIQTLARRRRTIKMIRMLQRSVWAQKVIAHGVRNFRRRRRRNAALILQAHARAAMVHRLGICHYRTLLLIIEGTRTGYMRCLNRMVAKRFALFRLEQKRREAAELVAKYDARRRARGQSLSSSAVHETSKPKPKRDLSSVTSRKQGLLQGLMPRMSLTSAPPVSARIPRFAASTPIHPLPSASSLASAAGPSSNTIPEATATPVSAFADSSSMPQAIAPPASAPAAQPPLSQSELQSHRSTVAAARAVLQVSDHVLDDEFGGETSASDSPRPRAYISSRRRLVDKTTPSQPRDGSAMGSALGTPSAVGISLRASPTLTPF